MIRIFKISSASKYFLLLFLITLSHILNTITHVFETGDDDRFCKFVPLLMPKTLQYLSIMRESKLLYLVWQMLQHTQWSVGTDQDTLEKCLNLDTLRRIMEQLLTVNFVLVNPLQNLEANGVVIQAVTYETLQEKRYCAKILTLLFREFMNTKKFKPEASKFSKEVFVISMKNLQYFLPFYLTTYTFNQNMDELDQEYFSEFQALVVQLLSLMSTLISLHSKVVLKELKHLHENLLTVMFQYCMEGVQYEKTYQEDPNIFLIDFLESGDDYESMISIRSTVCDFIYSAILCKYQFIEEACQHTDFNRVFLERVVAAFVQNSSVVTGDMSQLVFEKVKTIQSIAQLNEQDDLYMLQGFEVIKYEVAFFIIGQQHEVLTIPLQLIDQCIKLLNTQEPQVLLKLRALWLLEKLCSSSVIKKQKESVGRQVFQIISDLFVNQSEFIDQEACCRVVEHVMPGVMELYSKYYQDGMIGPDIVDLIKLWARLPNNLAFAQLFLPQANIIITQFYEYQCQQQNIIEATKMIDSSILKNMLSILTSYILQSKHRPMTQDSLEIIRYLFRMELEILNCTKEIYICIYTILSLSSFIHAVPDLVKEYQVQILTVLKKIISQPGGLDESSLLYVGHFILILMQNGDIDRETQQQIILILVKRLAKSQVPSTTKSFLIPIATSIIQYGEQSIQFLLKNSDIADIKSMLQNWMSYLSHFQDTFSKEISKRALIYSQKIFLNIQHYEYLLEYSKSDMDFAGLRIHLNEFSKQGTWKTTDLPSRFQCIQKAEQQLQVNKLSIIEREYSNYLVNADFGGSDDDDYEDEDCSDDDASVEEDEMKTATQDGGDGSKSSSKKKWGYDEDFKDLSGLNDSFGAGSGNHDPAHASENQDEEYLLSPYLSKLIKESGQPDCKTLAKITLKGLGRETLLKIVNTVTEDGDSMFSQAEKETLLSL